jgi:hypothetical protein
VVLVIEKKIWSNGGSLDFITASEQTNISNDDKKQGTQTASVDMSTARSNAPFLKLVDNPQKWEALLTFLIGKRRQFDVDD